MVEDQRTGETECRDRGQESLKEPGQVQRKQQRRDESRGGERAARRRASKAHAAAERLCSAVKSARWRGERQRRKGTRARAAEL